MRPREARGRAHARAALVGNPSDGFGGKTIGLTIDQFAAEAEVREAERLEIVPAPEDANAFGTLDDLVADVEANGYYGGLRLVRAALKRFAEHCRSVGETPHPTFAVSYATTIPRQVGLGGSSAIVIATLRALSEFNGTSIPPAALARLALSAELELGIPAGLQDRVIQAYEGLVFMDFSDTSRDAFERVDRGLLPPLFVAYRGDASEPSAAVHSELRSRWRAGDPSVVEGMREIARLAEHGREALRANDHERLGELMRANVEARARIVPLDPRHRRMVELADRHGAPANYTGSGGAIVGIGPPDGVEALRAELAAEGSSLIELAGAAPAPLSA